MDNRVSVIIPTYNRAGLIEGTVQSALAGVAPGDEIVVIDDGSTDNTAAVLRPLCEKIRYVHIEHSGPGAARNLGIKLAKGPLVTFLDSDDQWLPDKLYLQRAVMGAFPYLIFCFSNLLARRPDGEIVHNILALWRNDQWVGYSDTKKTWGEILSPGIPFSSLANLPGGRADFNIHIGDIYPALMEVYYVWTSSIMVRKDLAEDSFRFPEDLRICEDWECFARLARRGQVAYLDCETAMQNVHREPRLTDIGDIQQVTARIKLLNRVWGADESFLTHYSSRFESVLKAQHLRRARYLIKEGRMDEAKEDLKIIGGGPSYYRLLAGLPSPVVEAIITLRRKLIELNK